MKHDDKRTLYFKQLFYGGRNRVARALDWIVLRATIAAGAYVLLVFFVRPSWLALLLAAIITAMFCVAAHMLKKARYEKFVSGQMEKLRGEYMLEQLIMMPREQLRSVVEAYTLKLPNVLDLWEQDGNLLARREDESYMLVSMLQIHPSHKAGADELLEAYRIALECSANGLLLYSTAAFAEDAEALSKRLSIPISLFPPKKLVALAGEAELLPSESETEAALDVIISQKREQNLSLRLNAFSAGKVRQYLVCAGILAVASFITGYYVYYPILAAVCVSAALMAWWLNRKQGSGVRSQERGQGQAPAS